MKRKKIFLQLVIILPMIIFASLLAVSCGSNPSSPTITKFTKFIPYSALSTAEIVSLGADGFSGSDEAIANQILAWQDSHMKYVTPDIKKDVSYPMRWNYIMPGIYPVSDMIKARKIDDNGVEKIYGVCWDYAAIFCAIAKYYGLEVRIQAWKEYMSGIPGGNNGMGEDEYNELKPKLQSKGLTFSYETIRNAAKETWKHYRAQVKINGVWKTFDGTYPTGDYTNDANYTEASWDEGADPNLTQ